MSADNGIYLLYTNDGDIRVAHAQAIENIGEGKTVLEKASVVLYFKDSEVYTNPDKAFQKAKELFDNCSFVEYGISAYTIDAPYPDMTPSQALASMEDYYEAVQLEQQLNRVFEQNR